MLDPSLVLEIHPVELRDDMNYEVQPEAIVDRQVKKLRQKDIILLKVRWKGHLREEAAQELEDKMREEYPHLCDNLGKYSIVSIKFQGCNFYKVERL